ncbi:MAG TPA: DEAD/DEAH box helicase family protein [Bradyrhizobium sp.]|nr:DEAD/DEAH box helicase family protein [Bradyrhizobium sp.]
MSYFATAYRSFRFPLAEDGHVGFRPAQIAAAQAVAAHFFGSTTPAIVTMPTGAGKTTVLMACAIMLRAQRVLVITPSRLVREQIAENFRVLGDLKKIEALPLDYITPRVFSTKKTISSMQQWESLRDYDVVVATVPSMNANGDKTHEPPGDLFDLVLIDEAHHSPASTWARVLASFSTAKQILFTATPFRRDEKEIKGKFVFSYDLRRAHKDRVFGDISFEPVNQNGIDNIDVLIAQATERRFFNDKANGLNHLVMVRVDSISRGKYLVNLYSSNTSLRLEFVSGAHSLTKVTEVIRQLSKGEIDGIICVNMFGEGFNLPALKIAAVHSPHKSLAVTLQFIGRFARTNQPDVGSATFLAEPIKSNAEISELYEAGAVWRDIVENLSEARVESEIDRRDVLDSFVVESSPDMEDFSLYTIRPYFHVKVFRARSGVDLSLGLIFPTRYQVIFRGESNTNGSVIYLTRQTVRSPWSTDERFTNVSYDMFIFYYNAIPGLLFISASRRDDILYNRLAAQLLNARPRILAHSVISRALNDLEATEFFSIGMRKRHTLGRVESYRTSSGTSTDRAIEEADSKTFGRGHCFGTAVEDGKQVTIGVSASSKVWANTYDQIPALLSWCDKISEKISSGVLTPTGSRLDLLSVGEEIGEVPPGVIAMNWLSRTYREQPSVHYQTLGMIIEGKLLDFDLRIIESQLGSVIFGVGNGSVEWRGVFSISDDDLIQPFSDAEIDLVIHVGNEETSIFEYLNTFMPIFYCSDLSSIEGVNLLPLDSELDPFGAHNFEVVDWASADVLITKEIWNGELPKSIFDWLAERLLSSSAEIVFCDHGTGEIADFVVIQVTDAGPVVSMYHCKGSGAATAGARVDDLYEACGQALKSTVWLRAEELLVRLRHRMRLPSVRGFIKGDEGDSARLLALYSRQTVQFEIYIVQPGLRSSDLDRPILELLAGTRHYLISMSGAQKFGILSS